MSDIATAMKDGENKMNKAVDVAKEDLASIRTGRAHPSLFNKVVVDYYGAPTALNQLAHLLIVARWPQSKKRFAIQILVSIQATMVQLSESIFPN
jgi:hypothetical protein